jgi:hypothetical protein
MMMQSGISLNFVQNIMLNCYSLRTSLTNSDQLIENIQQTWTCPFSAEYILSLRKEIEELEAWDAEYFLRRNAKIAELGELVQSVIDIEVEGYFEEANEVLSKLDKTAEKYTGLLEKKMQVYTRVDGLIVGM